MREVLFEAQRVGDHLRVSAIDPDTGVEGVAIGPPTARAALETIALRKLHAALQREGAKTGEAPRPPIRPRGNWS